MRKLFFFCCLLAATLVASATTYEIKHPWGGGSWEYKTLTDAGDGTWYVNAIYGGTGCNWRADGANEKWIASPTVDAGMMVGDSARFTLDPSGTNGSITITLIEAGPREVAYYIKHPWNGGDWVWKKMTEVSEGVWVLRDIYGDDGCNINNINGDTNAAWKAKDAITFVTTPAKGDSAIFTYTVASSALQVEKIGAATDPVTPPTTPDATTNDTVYFANADMWTTVNCYMWQGAAENAEWPGAAMTKAQTVTYQGLSVDVYMYVYPTGKYTNVIFNDGTTQTADLTANAGKIFVKFGPLNGWYTVAELMAMAGGSTDPVTPPTNPDDEEDPTAERYYVFGYINGADYNEYDFPFVDGVATLSGITADSYVFVHAYNSGEEYFTNGWTDGASTVTLVNGKTLTSGHDKMLVPAGTTKLYLQVNADDTMILSLNPIQTALNDAEAAPVVLKVMIDGQLYIIRNGVRYNALGAVVE